MPQRKLDVVLDSVKRLLRVGATSNLVNLLQKQYPADLAQLFSELTDRDRQSAFSLLAERNSRLAMEALSELGPEVAAAMLAGRSAEEIVKGGLPAFAANEGAPQLQVAYDELTAKKST